MWDQMVSAVMPETDGGHGWTTPPLLEPSSSYSPSSSTEPSPMNSPVARGSEHERSIPSAVRGDPHRKTSPLVSRRSFFQGLPVNHAHIHPRPTPTR